MLTADQRRRGGLTRAQQFTTEYQRAAGIARAAKGDMADIGRKGWLTTAARHGTGIALGKAREYRLAHPSRHERRVIEILTNLGYIGGTHYEREAEIEGTHFTIDFYFPASRKAIEVNGEVHYRPPFQSDRRAQREQDKLRRLAELGIKTLVLDHWRLDEARDLVTRFLEE